MHYCTRFIHRLQENFLIVGLHDYEELQSMKSVYDEYVELSLDALCCLKFFPNIKHLILTSGTINPHDIPLLNRQQIRSLKLDFYTYANDDYTIDIGSFPFLELVFARTQFCFCNIGQCQSLKTLIVQEWLNPDLEYLCDSSIQALKIMSGKLRTLNGIAKIPNLVSLFLSNQHHLTDCFHLRETHLESLGLKKCKGMDITELPKLSNIKMLYLSGSKKIPSIHAILDLIPNLEWFLLDQAVVDGDVSLLKQLKHAVVFQNCRHYSHKDNELPKSNKKFYSEFLSYQLAILPEA